MCRSVPYNERHVTALSRYRTGRYDWRTALYRLAYGTLRNGTLRYISKSGEKSDSLTLPPTPNRRISALRIKLEEFFDEIQEAHAKGYSADPIAVTLAEDGIDVYDSNIRSHIARIKNAQTKAKSANPPKPSVDVKPARFEMKKGKLE